MLVQYLRQEVPLPDDDLLLKHIARKINNIHAVSKGYRYLVVHIPGADEEHLREIVRNLQVVIGKGVILLRIQHFQQGGGRITTILRREFVDFVEKENRVFDAHSLHRLDNTPGQRADIGAAMSANLRLVVHTTKRNAGKLAPQCVGYRVPQGCFTDSRGTNEAKNLPLTLTFRMPAAIGQPLPQLAYRQEFNDALLDAFQSIMVHVEDTPRLFKFKVILGPFVPWKSQYPVDVGAYHSYLGGLRGSALQAVDLFAYLRHSLSRQVFFVHSCPQFLDLARGLHAQFFLNGSQLLAQVIFFLRAVYLRANTAANSRFQFKNLDLIAHDHADLLQTLQWIERIQQILLLLRISDQVCREHIGKARSRLDRHNGVNIFN